MHVANEVPTQMKLYKYIAVWLRMHVYACLGSFEVQVATMSKCDRSRVEEVYVCSFIPSYKLPKKTPWSLDPFLSPLIKELETLFIEGS